jgi:hypothetical protein
MHWVNRMPVLISAEVDVEAIDDPQAVSTSAQPGAASAGRSVVARRRNGRTLIVRQLSGPAGNTNTTARATWWAARGR